MGQKTNPTIFNLSLKNAEWKSKYIEKNKEESSLFLYQDIEIRNYLDQVFKNFGLLIHNCKIEYGQETTAPRKGSQFPVPAGQILHHLPLILIELG